MLLMWEALRAMNANTLCLTTTTKKSNVELSSARKWKIGGTVVPPSNFQIKSHKTCTHKGFAAFFHHGHRRARIAQAHTQGRQPSQKTPGAPGGHYLRPPSAPGRAVAPRGVYRLPPPATALRSTKLYYEHHRHKPPGRRVATIAGHPSPRGERSLRGVFIGYRPRPPLYGLPSSITNTIATNPRGAGGHYRRPPNAPGRAVAPRGVFRLRIRAWLCLKSLRSPRLNLRPSLPRPLGARLHVPMLFLSALRPVRFASLCSARSGRFAPSYLAALFLLLRRRLSSASVAPLGANSAPPLRSLGSLRGRALLAPCFALAAARCARCRGGPRPAPLAARGPPPRLLVGRSLLRSAPGRRCGRSAPLLPPWASLARRAPRSLRSRGASAQRSLATLAGFFFGSALPASAPLPSLCSGCAALAGRARAALTAACSVSQIDAFSSILTLFGTAKSVTIWEPSHARRRQQLRAGSCTSVHSALRADITLTMINLASQLLLWCAGLRPTHA